LVGVLAELELRSVHVHMAAAFGVQAFVRRPVGGLAQGIAARYSLIEQPLSGLDVRPGC
jgi:hypothetical protein